ncbi:MAG TPA: RNA polymerase sigma factor, partial [Terriglobales bacterium]|nr:RNA polymerase sigma factor [Terriglobales bacterium]
MTNVAGDWGAEPAAALAPELDLGSSADFRSVVDLYSARLYRLAFRMTANRQDAEDLVQETFLRAYRSRARFQARAGVGTWLHRICINASLDHLRRHRVRPQAAAAADGDLGPAELLPSGQASPERLLLSAEASRRIETAMNHLTPVERAAFVLRHHEQLSIEEIGATLGLRTSATKNT